MVNELNKGPSQENLALGERLLSSQRQLQEMQEEHRRLLQEMEVLRHRATTLSRLHDQQFGHLDEQSSGGLLTQATNNENTTTQQTNATELSASEQVKQETTTTTTTTTTATSTDDVEQTSNVKASTSKTKSASPVSVVSAPENDEDVDPETAEYLQKKLAEIAQLKARFKRVQTIMNTTDMIEGHIASKVEGPKSSDATKAALEAAMDKLQMANSLLEVQSQRVTSTTTSAPQPISKSNEEDLAAKIDPTKFENTITDDEQTLNAYAPSQTPNEELLSAMMNMFTDFTADLRSQADDLRAERDRLRALKEDLLRRKRQS
ncbi:TNF receptor-associated factor family protein DDB_G0272098 [Rhagoletis pomonella]|uniref:TNF receptor-associated factor family protein DDB_G0272098 n=1 Tax=Rhagoletis pomonella TaxID=28610 RepID=UPI00177F1F62|nr:TNF receptor-associated factor family protein DDB_G0272098 [Rhagoletis pomonella]